jgi:hypothetical protein
VKLLTALVPLALVAWTPLPQITTTPQPLALPQPLEGFGRYARAASDGRGFYVVSSGNARGTGVTDSSPFNPQYGMAFDGLGDPQQDEISNSSGLARGLSAVASSGENYLVVWLEGTGDDAVLYARRVSAEGRPIDHSPIVVHQFEDSSFSPPLDFSVAWDGTRYIVAFERRAAGFFGAQYVSESGEVIGSDFDVVGSEVASDGNGTVLFATHQNTEITEEEIITVESLNVGPVQIGPGSQAVLAAGGSGDFLIAYHNSGDVWMRRLDRRAQPTGEPIMLSNRSSDPAVTWAGDHWLVVFTKGGQVPSVQGVRVGRDSVATPFVIAQNATLPAVASNGTRALVTWRRESDGVREKAMLDGTIVSKIVPLNRQLAAASVAGLAAMGETTLIGQTRNAIYGNVDVWAVRGSAVEHLTTFAGPERFDAIAASSDHGLVVTSTEEEFRFRIIDGAGRIAGENVFALRDPPRTVAAYWLGTQYRVTWTHELPDFRVEGYAITVDPAGRLGPRRFTPPGTLVARAAAADRTLTIFPQSRSPYGGTIEGPGGVSIPVGADSDPTASTPVSVASDGTGFMVAYRDVDGQMRIQRIEFDGSRGAGRLVPQEPVSWLTRTTLAWTGEYFVLLRWHLSDPLLYAMRIGPDTRLIDRDLVPIHTIPTLRYGNIPALLVRELNQIEVVSGTPPEPFGSPGKTWLRLGISETSRRRAVR